MTPGREALPDFVVKGDAQVTHSHSCDATLFDARPVDAQGLEARAVDVQLFDALSGFDTESSMVMVQRTRRAVRDAALSAMQMRRTRRRNAGIATLVALAFLVVLSPALWSVVDEFLRGEYLSDLTPMVTMLVAILLSGIFAALVAGWKNPHLARQGRRNI